MKPPRNLQPKFDAKIKAFELLLLQRADIVTMADSNVLSITFVNALSGDGIEMQVADPGGHRTDGFSCRGLP